LNKKLAAALITAAAIGGGLIIWHFTGLYREGKAIVEKELITRYGDILEENK
jgi:hypothetical protein